MSDTDRIGPYGLWKFLVALTYSRYDRAPSMTQVEKNNQDAIIWADNEIDRLQQVISELKEDVEMYKREANIFREKLDNFTDLLIASQKTVKYFNYAMCREQEAEELYLLLTAAIAKAEGR